MFTTICRSSTKFFDAKPSESKLEVKRIESLLVPPQIWLGDITDDGRLRVTQRDQIVALARKKMADKKSSILAEAKENKIDDTILKKKLDAANTVRFRKADLAQELGFKPECGVICMNGEIYFVYKGEKHASLAGEGGCGKVKLLQDLHGKWFVLKIIPIITSEERSINEYAMGKEIGLAKGILSRRSPSKDNQLQTEIIMEWIPRSELLDYIDTPTYMRPFMWINIILQMIKNVMDIHELGIISRDIKLENFMYDPVTETVRLIDLGLSSKLPAKNKIIIDSNRVGTPGYIAPETLLESPEYSEKSDIYSLGTAIAILLLLDLPLSHDITKQKLMVDGFKLAEESHPLFKSNPQIPNKSILSNILQFLMQMRSISTFDRPDLLSCFKFFSPIRDKLDETLNAGIISLDELIESRKDPAIRYALCQILKDMDKVWLIESKKHTILEYNIELRDLIKKNIPIGKYLFSQPGSEPLKIIEQIPTYIAREEKSQFFHLAYVTHQKIDRAYLAEKKVLVIHAEVIKDVKTSELRANRFLVDSMGDEKKKCGLR